MIRSFETSCDEFRAIVTVDVVVYLFVVSIAFSAVGVSRFIAGGRSKRCFGFLAFVVGGKKNSSC